MRKSKEVTIVADGRDKGKIFTIEELSCYDASRWSRHAFQALARTGVDISNYSNAGVAGIALAGFQALGLMPPAEADVLLDELMACVRIIRDPNHKETKATLIEGDLEEISTVVLLQMEAFELITGFSLAGVKSALMTSPATPSQV